MITLELNHKEEKIFLDGKEYYLFEAAKLEKLLEENTQLKADIDLLKGVVIDILKVLGLLDPQQNVLKKEIESGEEGFTKPLLKALGEVTKLLIMSKGFGGKDAERQLNEKFAFIPKLFPILKKYAGS